MRLNQFLAHHTDLSRRAADGAIQAGRVEVNGVPAQSGQQVSESDTITLDKKIVTAENQKPIILLLNKPTGYVCSRNGQGAATIYELLPPKYHRLNPAGRLDKNSSGLLVLTNDGELANQLTHPRYAKVKVYEVALKTPLEPLHQQMIQDYGIQLQDGPSKFLVEKLNSQGTKLKIIMKEGRNRQIRRTFEALGYSVSALHRTHFGDYNLSGIKPGEIKVL